LGTAKNPFTAGNPGSYKYVQHLTCEIIGVKKASSFENPVDFAVFTSKSNGLPMSYTTRVSNTSNFITDSTTSIYPLVKESSSPFMDTVIDVIGSNTGHVLSLY